MSSYVHRVMLLVVGVIAAAALMAPVASATTPIEIRVEPGGGHCPTLPTGCKVHFRGEATLFFHIFGIESTEATCQVEDEGRTDGQGEGYFDSYLSTNGGHGNTNCATVAPACAGTLPWEFHSEEMAANDVEVHIDTCHDFLESGVNCQGEYILEMIEEDESGPVEDHHLNATDFRVGSASFCEVTTDLEQEIDGTHPEFHVDHLHWRDG